MILLLILKNVNTLGIMFTFILPLILIMILLRQDAFQVSV